MSGAVSFVRSINMAVGYDDSCAMDFILVPVEGMIPAFDKFVEDRSADLVPDEVDELRARCWEDWVEVSQGINSITQLSSYGGEIGRGRGKLGDAGREVGDAAANG